MIHSDNKSRKRKHSIAIYTILILLPVVSLFLGGFAVSDTDGQTDEISDTDPTLIRFSHLSGTYSGESLKVTLTAPAGYTVAYTTDSSIPSVTDDCQKNQVTVTLNHETKGDLSAHANLMTIPNNTIQKDIHDDPSLPFGCVLRAMAVGPDGETGEVHTEVFFPGADFDELYPDCLVLSVVTDPDALLDYETGILASGAIYDSWLQTEEAEEIISQGLLWDSQTNFTQHGKEWERPCYLQIYDSGSRPVLGMNAGIRVAGHYARSMVQKAFNIYFRKEYGGKYLEYELFEGTERYRSFQLRNGGNNAQFLKFKGAMLQELATGRAFTTILSRPAVLFLNGEYWGPYILSEKISDEMLKAHYAVDPDQVVVIKQGEVEEGKSEDLALYEEMMSYADKDLTDSKVWDEFCGIMNIRSFADYCATRIYIGDADWDYKKNTVLWRTRDTSYDEGRWQYILYDVEFSSGLYNDSRSAPETNHFQAAKENNPLFAAAIRNHEFYELFMNSMREIGRQNFSSEHVNTVMQDYLDIWTPLMPDYYKRFGDARYYWKNELDATIRFFEVRYNIILPFCGDLRILNPGIAKK